MMSMLWAQQIMLGKKTYAQVPRLLKEQVKEILIDSGCEDLVTEQRYTEPKSRIQKCVRLSGKTWRENEK